MLAAPLHAQPGLWESRAPYPIPLTEVSGAEAGGRLYMMCGLTPQGSTTNAYSYDPATDEWRRIASLPIQQGADHCNVASVDGKIYLVGAIRIGSSFVDGLTRMYDPAQDRWETVATMPTPRGASGVAVIGRTIYVAGGLAGNNVVASFEAFNTETRQWRRLPDMPTPRDHLTAQAVGGRFYALSGRNGGTMIARTEEYDPAGNAWRQRAPIPVPRGGLASGVVQNRIVVFGGEGPHPRPERTFPENHEYDPVSDRWRELAPLPTPRHGFYGVSFENRVFVPGGGPREGGTFSDVHEVFYLPPSEPPAITGVREAAGGGTRLAAGALASLFGRRLSFGQAKAVQLPLPPRLNAVEVRLNDRSLPLLFTSDGQLNLYLPPDLPVGTSRLTVSNAGSASEPVNVTIAGDAGPGIFTIDGSGRGQGAILIAGTGLIARATRDAFSRPARHGDIVEIYCTGLGAVEGSAPERTRLTPEVIIGGGRADVLFSGLAPGFVGLNQINARVPTSAGTGIGVTVSVRIGGQTSNEVVMSVVE
jgi:uncharacterized protein (TIGR03437 family)